MISKEIQSTKNEELFQKISKHIEQLSADEDYPIQDFDDADTER